MGGEYIWGLRSWRLIGEMMGSGRLEMLSAKWIIGEIRGRGGDGVMIRGTLPLQFVGGKYSILLQFSSIAHCADVRSITNLSLPRREY